MKASQGNQRGLFSFGSAARVARQRCKRFVRRFESFHSHQMDDRERKREAFLAKARAAGARLATSTTSMLASRVPLAQLAEQRAFTSLVEGSTPSGNTDDDDDASDE